MSLPLIAEFALFLLVVTALVRPVGGYLTRVFTGQRTWLDPALSPLERGIYRFARVDPHQQMDWHAYALSFVLFGVVGTLLLFGILVVQPLAPWNNHPYLTTPMTPDLALNTAVSFVTTTTWQAYAGESTMSYISQMAGLAAQNFLAGAAGLAVGIAFIRGFARTEASRLGNFWVDLVRATLWVLLPASLIGGLFLVWQGVPMNFSSYTTVHTLEGGAQTIAQGPVAALEFIESLGTNGGGFFNANNAHPFQDPTPLANVVEMLAIAVVPAALTYTFGRMVGRPRQGWVLFWVMAFLFAVGLATCGAAEQSGNPLIAARAHYTTAASAMQPGGNMEGKEARFGIGDSVLTTIVTSNGATGATNAAHDSYTPLGGLVPLVNMALGEIVFGGLGTGLYSIVLVALVGLFIAGLMVGRTPEYLGKKIEPRHMKVIMTYTLAGPVVLLTLAALAVATDAGKAGLTTNGGPHGLTEILFAYTSTLANNGQTFGGLSANSPFYNLTTVVSMLMGRYVLGVLALALAGIFVGQRQRPATLGTLPTDSFQFGVVIVGTAILVGALTFFPAYALGPAVEHLQMVAGR
jgi:K+-transporting ATPase ATPase A chain